MTISRDVWRTARALAAAATPRAFGSTGRRARLVVSTNPRYFPSAQSRYAVWSCCQPLGDISAIPDPGTARVRLRQFTARTLPSAAIRGMHRSSACASCGYRRAASAA